MALSADDIYWPFRARELMKEKKCFVVERWARHFDELEARPLLKEFGYLIDYRENEASRAFFSPKDG